MIRPRIARPIAIAGLLAASSGGCDSSDDGALGPVQSGSMGGVAGSSAGGHAGAGGTIADAGVGGEAPDAGPSPHAYDPCATASCWTAPTLGACGSTTVDEDFRSGSYNVHHYLLMAPAGVDLQLTLTRTAGAWSPALIVHDEQGTTVHDGELSLSTDDLEISTVSPPPSADAVAVRIRAASYQHLAVYVTGTGVVASDFASSLPTEAEYSLDAAVGCAPQGALEVRGIELDARQELWVRYIAARIVPDVPGSSPSERIDKTAYVTWWSLKEGVLNTNNPLAFSSCSFPPDERIGPLEICPNPDHAWQVALSAVQAAWRTLDGVEQIALTVYPQESLNDILVDAAATAGFGAATSIGQSIAASTDRLRLSWLLRNGAVGFEAEYPVVFDDCFVSQETWCFGTGFPTSTAFAPTRAAALEVIADLRTIFEALSL